MKRRKTVLSVFFCALVLFPAALLPVSGYSAEAYCLIEKESRAAVSEKNADRRLPMASTTKLMTALVALENADPSDRVPIPKEAVGVEGSSVSLREGEVLSLGELLAALLLESANDAASAIAVHLAGSIPAFAEMMNEKAREIGLSDTHFRNPHGLDEEGHYTTARDLAVLLAECLENETLAGLIGTKRTSIPLNGEKDGRLLVNHNRLLFSFEGCLGGKTGYTASSGRCLVTAAERDGVSLICATINAPDDWNDQKALYEAGFPLFEHVVLAREGDIGYVIPLVGGEKDSVFLTNPDRIEATLSKSGGKITHSVEVGRFYYAPVKRGEVLGKITFFLDGKEIGMSFLSARETIAAEKKGRKKAP